MAGLQDEFENEEDLSSEFDKETDLSSEFDKEPEAHAKPHGEGLFSKLISHIPSQVAGGVVNLAGAAIGPQATTQGDVPDKFGSYELSDTDKLLARAKTGDLGEPARNVAQGLSFGRQVVDSLPMAKHGPKANALEEELLGNGSYDENLKKEEDARKFRKSMYGDSKLQDIAATLAAYGVAVPGMETAAGRVAEAAGIGGSENAVGSDEPLKDFVGGATTSGAAAAGAEVLGEAGSALLNKGSQMARGRADLAKKEGLEAAEKALNSQFNSELGAQGPVEAEAVKTVRDYFGNAVPRKLLGSAEKAALDAERATAREIANRQASKGAEVLRNYKPPSAPTPVTQARIDALTAKTMAEEAAASKGAFRDALVDKGGRVVRDAIEDIPVAGKIIKGGRQILHEGQMAHRAPGARHAFWGWAAQKLATDPSSLGRFHSVVLGVLAGNDSPEVTDFVLSQSDPEWRQLKEEASKEAE